MKKLIAVFLLYLLFPFHPILSYEEPTLCQMNMSEVTHDPIPNYLQSWWGYVRTGKFAVVYVDFPDGRYINGSDTLQPIYDYQLEWVYVNGEPDAAGEMGLINETTNIPVGNKYMKASKYNWYDRWNMFFDSAGVYYGNAHPDWASHGDSAWGSMKQYWKEASNGKFELIPYTTHPNESNYKLRSGIINDYEMVNGVPVIKYIKQPFRKYGSDNSNSYLRAWDNGNNLEDAARRMIADAEELVENTSFNLEQFYNEGGTLFVIYAGSHKFLKDIGGFGRKNSIIRCREERIQDQNSKIDGFGVSAHQYGHLEFGWLHTNSGRCDIMNGGDVHDNNSPQLPNPVYRMLQGWLQPIALDSIHEVSDLSPVETSYQCGVITIYGKPSAAPDWSSGECFVVENRRRLGFDRKIINEEVSTQFPNFKGGLLIWHFSPYYSIFQPYCCGIDGKIKFKHNDTTGFLMQNRGNPKTFFAWDEFTTSQFYNIDSSKTKSGVEFQTGIEIRDIGQLDYGSLYSDMRFDLNYLITEPTDYDDVIFYRDYNPHVINYSGNIFYHAADEGGYFILQPGTRIEHPGNFGLSFKNIKAKGTEISPITFTGVGYTSEKTKYSSIYIGNSIYSIVDSLIFSNIKMENYGSPSFIQIGFGTGFIIPTPIILKNIETIDDDNVKYPVNIVKSSIYTLDLKKKDIIVFNSNSFGKMILDSCEILFHKSNSIFDGSGSYFSTKPNTTITSDDSSTFEFKNGAFVKFNGATFEKEGSLLWKGIRFENSGNDTITGCTFNNVMTALKITNSNPSNLFHQRLISDNTFNIPTGGAYFGIYAENCYNINIQGNTFNMPSASSYNQIGAFLKNSAIGVGTIQASGQSFEEDLEGSYILNVTNNVFNNGAASLVVTNYTSNFLPYYIAYNTFNHCSQINLLLMKVTGKIKNNYFSSVSTPKAINIFDGNPGLYKNYINSNSVSLHLSGFAYPSLSPVHTDGDLVWTGGNNTLYSQTHDNVHLNSAGNIFTDFGHNVFITNSGDGKHIYGFIDTIVETYYTRENCWLNIGPQVELRHNSGSDPIPVIYSNYGFTCTRELVSPENYDIRNMGNGNYDTVISSEDNTGTVQNEEDALYQQGYECLMNGFYTDAILNNKLLINNYPGSFYLETVLYDLYAAYESLDTSSDQGYKNILYGNLNAYLESKIESELYSTAFNSISFDLTLMCLANMEEYNDAMNGYEFLALFHPDPDIRLAASWNYAEIEALIGSGGGNKKQVSINHKRNELRGKELQELIEFNRLNEIIINDPIMNKLKESYEKISLEREKSMESNIRLESKNETDFKMNLNKANQIDNLKQEKAKRNIFELKNLNEAQLEKRRTEDLFLMSKNFRGESNENKITNLPFEYKLYQNYPNPFNPVTTITFEIPRDGNVSIKVFDITGREVSSLVNEFKQTGIYSVDFNGSNLSSGVYFYKLFSGGFIAIKRKVLIK